MTILEHLRQDHTNMRRLLGILEDKVVKLRNGEQLNFGMLEEVIDYLKGYADAYHHPWEKQLFSYFQGRDTELDTVMARCETHHNEMMAAGESLAESLDCILHDAVMPMERFTDQLEQFATQQPDHLALEADALLPLLMRTASEDDWSSLEHSLGQPEDPLFGEVQSTRYSLLYQHLMSEEVEEA